MQVDRYRLTVSGKTCVFEKDNDPTLLRSASAGKLLKFLVDDGGHVNSGQAYAEIEVMKMVMSLCSPSAGVLQHRKVAGCILESGDIVSVISLDDASQVRRAHPFRDHLPFSTSPETVPTAPPHELFRHVLQSLQATLQGYNLPEDIALPRIKALIVALFHVAVDPKLPLLQMRELLATISGRLPQAVEAGINQQLYQYEKTHTSFLSKFPTKKIMAVIDGYQCSEVERRSLMLVTQDMFQLLDGYRLSVRGHLAYVVEQLMRQYLDVEKLFYRDGKSHEHAVLSLRADYKDSLHKVAELVFAHSQVCVWWSLVS